MIKKVINKIYSSGARPREPEPRKELFIYIYELIFNNK